MVFVTIVFLFIYYSTYWLSNWWWLSNK